MSNIKEKFTVRFNPLIIDQEEADDAATALYNLLLDTGSAGETVTEAYSHAFQGGWEIIYTGEITYPQFGNTGNNHTAHLTGTATCSDNIFDDVARAIVAIREEQLRGAYRNAIRGIRNDIVRLNVDEVSAPDMVDYVDSILEAFPRTN